MAGVLVGAGSATLVLPLVGIIIFRPTGGPQTIVVARKIYKPRSGRPTRSGPVRQGSGRLEGQNGDLRWAVEAEGKAHGADATVDVELHLVELIWALGVLFAHRGQDKRA